MAIDQDCFLKSFAWLNTLGQEQSFWRTSQRCLVTEWEQYSDPWPDSGMMRSGTAYKLCSSVRHIEESECSSSQLWPTPTANEDAAGKPTGKMQRMLGNHPDVRNSGTGTLNPQWVEWLMGFPIGFTETDA